MEKPFNLELLKQCIHKNIKAADSYVEIKLVLANGTTASDTYKKYYEGKSDAFKSVLTLIENIQKEG